MLYKSQEQIKLQEHTHSDVNQINSIVKDIFFASTPNKRNKVYTYMGIIIQCIWNNVEDVHCYEMVHDNS